MNSNTAVDLTAYIPELEKAFPSLKWEVVKEWQGGTRKRSLLRTVVDDCWLDIFVDSNTVWGVCIRSWRVEYRSRAGALLRLNCSGIEFKAGPVVALKQWIQDSRKNLQECTTALDGMEKGEGE